MSTKGSPSRAVFRAFALAACFIVAAACRVSPRGTLIGPTIGPQPWWLVESAHFTLRSDVGAAEAREIVIDLERTYRILYQIGFPTKKPPNFHTDIVTFSDADDYHRVGPRGSDGVFLGTNGLDVLNQPTFLAHGGLESDARRTLVHELTHQFVHYVCPQAPVWLNEGLAEYYSTVDVEGGAAVLGKTRWSAFTQGNTWDKRRPGSIPLGAVPNLGALWGMRPEDFYAEQEAPDGHASAGMLRAQQANYAGAWAAVHALLNGSEHNNELFFQWLAKMAAGAPALPSYNAVWNAKAQDGLDEDVKHTLADLVESGQGAIRRVDYDVNQVASVADRALTEAEINLLQAKFAIWRRDAPEVRRLLDAALASDPTLTEARLWSARLYGATGDRGAQERELLEASARAPNDERVAYALYLLYKRPPYKGERDVDARRAKAEAILAKWLPIAQSSAILNGFAWDMAMQGRADEAARIAKRATELNPSCAGCFDTLAVSLFRKGDFKAAVLAQEIGVALLGERASGGEMLARLKIFQKAWAAYLIWKKHPAPGQDPAVLPRSVVEGVLLEEELLFWDCYLDVVPDPAVVNGAIVVRGEIGPDGALKTFKVVPPDQWAALGQTSTSPPLTDEAAARCAVERVGRARFPESSQPTTFVVPIELRRSK